jgi:nicotinamidase/pyrazinamidase
MERTTKKALVLVDVQNDFINGSLAVEGGDKVVPKINKLTTAFRRCLYPILTTQDWHPHETAHFADEPNYVDTWPVHCVAGSHGAELHPDLEVAKHHAIATRFVKGDVACESPEDDTSYTGVLAYNPETGTTLPDWLQERYAKQVYVAGLALGDGDEHKLCVDSTAADLYDRGYEVTLITDAAEAVMPENRAKCFKNLGEKGIRLMTMAQVLEEIGYED